jgi:hypothetical protein
MRSDFILNLLQAAGPLYSVIVNYNSNTHVKEVLRMVGIWLIKNGLFIKFAMPGASACCTTLRCARAQGAGKESFLSTRVGCPIFRFQAFDAGEDAIIGDKRGVGGHSMCGDQEVKIADGLTSAFQAGAQEPIFLSSL